MPRRIFFLESIPKSATGKSARAALAALLQPQLAPAPEALVPAGEIEKKLMAIWRRILQAENVGTADDFFQLGGDSLALTLMIAEVDLEFGAKDQVEFLSSPTVATLARIVSRAPATHAEKSFFVPLQPHGSRAPFFCFPGADENPYYFLELAKGLGRDQPFIIVRDPRPLEERGVYTLEEHAAIYCRELRAMRGEGPYLLGGHCYGGILAFEVARQLGAAGQQVDLLVLFEVPTPGHPKVMRHWRKYLKHAATLMGSLASGQAEAVRRQARAHAMVLRQLFGRKKQSITRRVLLHPGRSCCRRSGDRLVGDCAADGHADISV